MLALLRALALCGLGAVLSGTASAQVWSSHDGLILDGDLVTMNGSLDVIAGGRVVIHREKIIAVLGPDDALPDDVDLSRARTVITGGWIFPGLIDSHNHLTYNTLPLYEVPQPYANRYQWTGPPPTCGT